MTASAPQPESARLIFFMKPRNFRSAFALSELLLILALLAILAALALPAFVRARQDAARANCRSNLHEIGLAWLQYARDSDNTMMRFSQDAPCDSCLDPTSAASTSAASTSAASTFAASTPAPVIYWWGARQGDKYDSARSPLRPYLAGDKSYSCPAFARADGGDAPGLASYGYNAGALSPTRYGPAPDFTPTPIAAKLSALADAARTVAFADAAQLNSKGALRPSTYLSNPRSDFPNFHARHEEMGHALFCDGHIAAIAPVYRANGFKTYAGLTATALRDNHLGDVDEDGDLATSELFNGKGKP